MQLSGTNADAFDIDFTPVSLNPGEQLDVKVDLDTGTLGYKSAKAEIFHDGNNGALEVELEGTVVTPSVGAGQFHDQYTEYQSGRHARDNVAIWSGWQAVCR